jgi:hypothetical protein
MLFDITFVNWLVSPTSIPVTLIMAEFFLRGVNPFGCHNSVRIVGLHAQRVRTIFCVLLFFVDSYKSKYVISRYRVAARR